MVESKSFSLEGYSVLKWFLGNWKTIKEFLKVGIPALIGWSVTANPELTGLITIGGKFLIDLGEFYFKEFSE